MVPSTSPCRPISRMTKIYLQGPESGWSEAKHTTTKEVKEMSEEHTYGRISSPRLDMSTVESMRRVHEAHRFFESRGNVISNDLRQDEWLALIGMMASYVGPDEFRWALRDSHSYAHLAQNLVEKTAVTFRPSNAPVPKLETIPHSEDEEDRSHHILKGESGDSQAGDERDD